MGRGAAHANHADQLLIDHDGKPAGIRKLAELYQLEFRVGILDHAVHQELAGRAIHERGTRLHLGRDDVQITLTIHAVHVHVVAVIIEHHDADLHALGGGGLLARIRDALRGGQIDGGEILNLFGRFAAHHELLRYVLSKCRAARRDDCG